MDAKQEEEAAAHAEQFESIPWASLVPDATAKYRKYAVIGVTIIAGVVIGLIGGRVLRGATQPGVVVTLPAVAGGQPLAAAEPLVSPVPSDVPQIPPAVPTTVGSGPAIPSPLPPQLYSEADLMAVMPEEEQRIAVMRAEWFVTDFFTIDGDASTAQDVIAALPQGGELPLPHESGTPGISYVEWARAYRLEPLGPGRYRVTVAYRTLAGPAVGNLTRSPVRAASVDIEVDGDGATVVLDLPSPVPGPGTLAIPASVVPDMDAPPEVLAAALQAAVLAGSDPAVLTSGLGDDGWRVLVLIGDQSGLRWPLAVRPSFP